MYCDHENTVSDEYSGTNVMVSRRVALYWLQTRCVEYRDRSEISPRKQRKRAFEPFFELWRNVTRHYLRFSILNHFRTNQKHNIFCTIMIVTNNL